MQGGVTLELWLRLRELPQSPEELAESSRELEALGPRFILPKYDEIRMRWRDSAGLSQCSRAHSCTLWHIMKRGLFRTIDSFLGECARVHEDAGDAFPFLRPDLYRMLGFQPPYEELPLLFPKQSSDLQG